MEMASSMKLLAVSCLLFLPSSVSSIGQGELVSLKGGIATIGEYYIHVELGNPPQRLRVQVDTGSSSLVVPGDDCSSCHETSLPPYDDEVSPGVPAANNVREAADMNTDHTVAARSNTVNRAISIKKHRAKFYSVASSSTAAAIPCSSEKCGFGTCMDRSCMIPLNQCPANSNNACCSISTPEYCGFYLRYGGDSNYKVTASGLLVEDVLQLGSHSSLAVNATIYQTQKETGPWPSQVDGILGLAFKRLNCNPTCSTPAFDSLLLRAGEASGAGNVFAMCFGDTGGKLVVGGDGTSYNLNQGKIHYVPMLGSVKTFYVIGVQEMKIGDERIIHGSMEAIVDSGTTLLLLQRQIWNKLVHHMTERYCYLPGVCAQSIQDTIFTQGVCLTVPPHGFPTITVHLSHGVALEMPPELYFIRYVNDSPMMQGIPSHVYCFGIQPGGDSRTVIGNTLMRGYLTVFDRESLQVGFASAAGARCTNQIPAVSGSVVTGNGDYSIPSLSGLYSSTKPVHLYLSGLSCGAFLLLVLYWGTGGLRRSRQKFDSRRKLEKLDLGPNAMLTGKRKPAFGTFEPAQSL